MTKKREFDRLFQHAEEFVKTPLYQSSPFSRWARSSRFTCTDAGAQENCVSPHQLGHRFFRRFNVTIMVDPGRKQASTIREFLTTYVKLFPFVLILFWLKMGDDLFGTITFALFNSVILSIFVMDVSHYIETEIIWMFHEGDRKQQQVAIATTRSGVLSAYLTQSKILRKKHRLQNKIEEIKAILNEYLQRATQYSETMFTIDKWPERDTVWMGRDRAQEVFVKNKEKMDGHVIIVRNINTTARLFEEAVRATCSTIEILEQTIEIDIKNYAMLENLASEDSATQFALIRAENALATKFMLYHMYTTRLKQVVQDTHEKSIPIVFVTPQIAGELFLGASVQKITELNEAFSKASFPLLPEFATQQETRV